VDRAGPGAVGGAAAGAAEGGGGGAWLDGDAAAAITCDAAMAPVVTSEVNVDALEELVRLCVLLDRHRRGTGGPGDRRPQQHGRRRYRPRRHGPRRPQPQRCRRQQQ
jgi:hypothetical protein